MFKKFTLTLLILTGLLAIAAYSGLLEGLPNWAKMPGRASGYSNSQSDCDREWDRRHAEWERKYGRRR